MRSRQRHLFALTSLIVLVVGTVSVTQEPPPPSDEPVLEYSRDPHDVVIKFDIWGDFRDETPLIRIFGDGRVLVHRQTKGDYETYLSEVELQEWIRFLYDKGALTFKVAEIKRTMDDLLYKRNLQAQSRGESVKSSGRFEGGETTIEVNLKMFKAEGVSAERIVDFSHRVTWDEPKFTSNQFPEIPELARFAEAVAEFELLMRDPELVRVENE